MEKGAYSSFRFQFPLSTQINHTSTPPSPSASGRPQPRRSAFPAKQRVSDAATACTFLRSRLRGRRYISRARTGTARVPPPAAGGADPVICQLPRKGVSSSSILPLPSAISDKLYAYCLFAIRNQESIDAMDLFFSARMFGNWGWGE